jgi:hypothetical protein
MAMESPHVTADVIEANEFPQLSARYAVQAVPKTVVNDRAEFLGAVPESRFLQEVLAASTGGPAAAERSQDAAEG